MKKIHILSLGTALFALSLVLVTPALADGDRRMGGLNVTPNKGIGAKILPKIGENHPIYTKERSQTGMAQKKALEAEKKAQSNAYSVGSGDRAGKPAVAGTGKLTQTQKAAQERKNRIDKLADDQDKMLEPLKYTDPATYLAHKTLVEPHRAILKKLFGGGCGAKCRTPEARKIINKRWDENKKKKAAHRLDKE